VHRRSASTKRGRDVGAPRGHGAATAFPSAKCQPLGHRLTGHRPISQTERRTDIHSPSRQRFSADDTAVTQTRSRKRRLDHDRATALADSDAEVRYAALVNTSWLDQAALTLNAGAIAALLTDTVPRVRKAAAEALGNLHPDKLALHAGAIVSMLADADHEVHYVAIKTIYRLDQTAFTLHAEAILRIMKQRRARLHWATARMYRVRWYGRFWYEYTLEKLCAPGGKWAERDRAAFEAEFI